MTGRFSICICSIYRDWRQLPFGDWTRRRGSTVILPGDPDRVALISAGWDNFREAGAIASL